MSLQPEDRRRATRVVPRGMVRAVVESARESASGVVADVSEGGVSLLPARSGLRTRDELILSLSFPGHDPVAATGQVVWVVKSEHEPGRFGVRWTHTGVNRERLEALIRHCG